MFLCREEMPFLRFTWRSVNFSDRRWISLEAFGLLGAGFVGCLAGGAVGAKMPLSLPRAASVGFLVGGLAAVGGVTPLIAARVLSENGHPLVWLVCLLFGPVFILVGALFCALLGLVSEVIRRNPDLFKRPLLTLAALWPILVLVAVLLAPSRQRACETEAIVTFEQLGGVWIPDPGGSGFARVASEGQMEAATHLRNVEGIQYTGPEAGLAYVKKLSSLKSMQLYHNPGITDASLAHLKSLTGLRDLRVGGCAKVTDAGVAHLAGLTQLRWLDLRQTQLSDTGLACLEKMSDMEELQLSRTHVSDAGLVHLKSMTRLQYLEVCLTAVTEEGARALQRAIPGLHVVH
jgi:hypothetical protein